jgi:dienelactone hydrolase
MKNFAAAAFGAALVSVFHVGAANAEIHTEYVDYVHNGETLTGYLAYDDAIDGPRPGVLIAYNRAGMTDKARADTVMFAEQGYVAFSLDMFGKGNIPREIPEMQALTRVFDADRALMRSRARAGLDVLLANPMVDTSRVAAIGYCFGGTTVIELAESGAPLVGVVPVHGSFRNFTSADAANIQGRVLILHGAEDETAPVDTEVNKLIGDLKAANVVWQLEIYAGATHGFSEPSTSWDELADREYRQAAMHFFSEVFD